MKLRKGQAATEYLMTYGWALIAIVVVGALIYTFVLKGCPEARTSSPGSEVFVTDFQIKAAGAEDDTIVLQNNAGKDVTITAIALGSVTDPTPTTIGSATISSGNKETFTATLTGAVNEGSCFSETITITYNTADITGKTATGSLGGAYAA